MTISFPQIAAKIANADLTPEKSFHRLLSSIIGALNALEQQSGAFTGTPDASGYLSVPHALKGAAIAKSAAQPTGATAFQAQAVSADDTTLTVRLFNTSGVPLTSGSYTITWKVGK